MDNSDDEEDDDSGDEYAVTNDYDESDTLLSYHVRCASHTLSLICTTDADKATKHKTYKQHYYSVKAKLSSLWNRAGRPKTA